MQLTFSIHEDKFDDLQRMKIDAGASGIGDILDNALTLYEWAILQRKMGRVIGALDSGGEFQVELSMPLLNGIKPQDQK